MATMFSAPQASRRSPAGFGGGVFGRFLAALLQWDGRARERGQLRTLDDRALADIGLTRADILREVEKHFWQR